MGNCYDPSANQSKNQIADITAGQYIIVAKSDQGKIIGHSSLIILK
ncbi:MAG: hypothetical protein ABI002_07635 [Saprospiraceae bacterium]